MRALLVQTKPASIALLRVAGLKSLIVGLLLAVLGLVAAPVRAQTAEPLWPHHASDISPDPSVTFGVLPNGMRYALKPNQLPPGAVSIRFAIEFGSLHEAEEEAGYAHFIEHMAFNGSRRVPEGEMVRILERLGLAFGADTNASTSQTETIYKLELPNASDRLIDESLFLLRETASELTFSQEAVDRERGVVLAEHRRGDTFVRRRSQQLIDFLLPDALAPGRLPIGSSKALMAATRDELADLYHRYYRPERAVLVVAGDFDVGAMEQRIIARFSDWEGVGPPGTDPDAAWKPPHREPAASIFIHPDGGDSISMYAISRLDEPPDTAAQRRENNLFSFGLSALNRRFRTLEEGESPPFRRASASQSEMLNTAEAASVTATISPGQWRRALEAVEQEWRRALEFGFTEDEIAIQIANMRTSVENAAKRESTRQTPALAESLMRSILDDAVFATPASGLERFNSWINDATADDVLEIFRRRMGMSVPLFFYAGVEDEPGLSDAIVEAWKESRAVEVAPPDRRTFEPFAYTSFGSPGRVAADSRRADIAARFVRFENNVRLNIKTTDFQKGSVMVSVRIGAGPLEFPEKPFGLRSLMSAFSSGGLERHSADELRGILAGRSVQAGFSASQSAFGATYRTTPADLLLQLQVAAAFTTAPGYRPEAERRWRESIVLSWPRLAANARAVLGNTAIRTLMSGDRRFGTDPDDGVVLRSFTELRAYLEPVLATGAVEIAIVGDIEEEAAIEAVARTFGALPARDPAPAKFKDDRPAAFRSDPAPIVVRHHGEADQALVSLYWPVTDVDPLASPQEARVLNLLAGVMRLKATEEIREALGAAYSPSVQAGISSTIPGWGYISASSEVRPEDADKVASAMKAIAADLRAGGISDDEFQRAVTPMLQTLPQNATSNSYWLSLLSSAQTRPDLVDSGKLDSVEAGLRSITVEDLVAAARTYLGEAAAREIRILPEAGRTKP